LLDGWRPLSRLINHRNRIPKENANHSPLLAPEPSSASLLGRHRSAPDDRLTPTGPPLPCQPGRRSSTQQRGMAPEQNLRDRPLIRRDLYLPNKQQPWVAGPLQPDVSIHEPTRKTRPCGELRTRTVRQARDQDNDPNGYWLRENSNNRPEVLSARSAPRRPSSASSRKCAIYYGDLDYRHIVNVRSVVLAAA